MVKPLRPGSDHEHMIGAISQEQELVGEAGVAPIHSHLTAKAQCRRHISTYNVSLRQQQNIQNHTCGCPLEELCLVNNLDASEIKCF